MPMRKNAVRTPPVQRVETGAGHTQRERILDKAKSLLLQGGPDAVVLRSIADSLGMRHSNVQYYYPTREALLVAIFDKEAAKYAEQVTAAVAAAPRREQRVEALVDTILALLRAPDTALWRLMIGMLDHNPQMAALHKKEVQIYGDVLMGELKRIFPDAPIERRRRAVMTIQVVLSGLAVLFAHSTPGSPESRLLETRLRDVLTGLIKSELTRR